MCWAHFQEPEQRKTGLKIGKKWGKIYLGDKLEGWYLLFVISKCMGPSADYQSEIILFLTDTNTKM